MDFKEFDERIKRIDDSRVVSALRDIIGSCKQQNMSADETYEYIIKSLKGMK